MPKAIHGSVTMAYSGGTGDLELVVIDILLTDIVTTLDSLCASDYTATVIDENGCEVTEPFTIDAPPPLEFLIKSGANINANTLLKALIVDICNVANS